MLAKTDSACYGPYVHLIEFASFQAECQMDSLPSDKSDEVFPSCSLTSFRFIKILRSQKNLSFSRTDTGICKSANKFITEDQNTRFTQEL